MRYIPFRLDYARCSNKCPPKDTGIAKGCIPRDPSDPSSFSRAACRKVPQSGNMNMPASLDTEALRYATAIRAAFQANRGTEGVNAPTTTFRSDFVNIFGRRNGTPGGSGSAPRNRF